MTRFRTRLHAAPALGLAALTLLALAPSAARAQTQDLFVSNYGSNTISRFAGTGPGTFSTTPTTLSGSLAGPAGLAFDGRGDLFAANDTGNAGAGSITEFASTGAGTFGTGQTVETGLNAPTGLAFDAGGNLFAANYNGGNAGAGSITEFASTGAGTFGTGTTLTAPNLSFPRGLAFDARGDLFAANFNSSTRAAAITEFVSTGAGTFGTGTTLTAPSLTNPQGLAFDAGGDLFAVNFTSFANESTITEFASTGAGTFGMGQAVETGLDFPLGLAFGPSAPPAVPEASTTISLGLLALGLGGLVVAGKRRKNKASS